MQEEPEEEDDKPPGLIEGDIDAIMADAEAEAEEEEDVGAPPPPQAAKSGGWEVDPDDDMWAADGAGAAADAPRLQADGGEGVAFKAAEGAAAKRRMRKRPAAKGADVGGAEEEEVKPDGALMFELQKGLGRGLSEALLMVRERGWLGAVDYRGRISDFKHNQRSMVRPAQAAVPRMHHMRRSCAAVSR